MATHPKTQQPPSTPPPKTTLSTSPGKANPFLPTPTSTKASPRNPRKPNNPKKPTNKPKKPGPKARNKPQVNPTNPRLLASTPTPIPKRPNHHVPARNST